MTSSNFSVHRVVEVAISSFPFKRKDGTIWGRDHRFVTINDKGEKTEIDIYGKDGKELITSVNGKLINKEA